MDRPKSRRTARLLAIGCTVGPLLIGGALLLRAGLGTNREAEAYTAAAFGGLGLGVGPSAGHFYAGEYQSPALRLLLRTVLVLGGGALAAWGWTDYAFSTIGWTKQPVPKFADLKIVTGAILLAAGVGLAIYDCYDASRAVDRVNAARAGRAVVAPFVARVAGGTQYGVAVTSAF